MRDRPKVALLVHTATEWVRQVLRGVASYAHERGGWDFHLEARGMNECIELPHGWQADGIIARLTSDGLRRAIEATGIPAVNVSWMDVPSGAIPQVISDEAKCAEMAAQHFLERGFVHFAYVGPIDRTGYADHLGRHFQATVERAGHRCERLIPRTPQLEPLHLHREAFIGWLTALSKPVALLVWSCDIAREITFACQACGLAVPGTVAVLCNEYDSVMSSLAPVPISNMDQAGPRVGYEASRLLDQLMQGMSPPAQVTLIPPVGIVQRQSTDTTAVRDTIVAAAMHFIADHVNQPMQVGDLCRQFDISRRALEQRFLHALGHSPAMGIRRARLHRVKRLLVETNLPLSAIAAQAGYNHTEVMIRSFRRELGMSPGQFRRSH